MSNEEENSFIVGFLLLYKILVRSYSGRKIGYLDSQLWRFTVPHQEDSVVWYLMRMADGQGTRGKAGSRKGGCPICTQVTNPPMNIPFHACSHTQGAPNEHNTPLLIYHLLSLIHHPLIGFGEPGSQSTWDLGPLKLFFQNMTAYF